MFCKFLKISGVKINFCLKKFKITHKNAISLLKNVFFIRKKLLKKFKKNCINFNLFIKYF